jgi:2-polyprenyl-3-methyl-5-hydroxy-6-metoxy-1,4-benzoquinol methylase
MSKKKEWWQEIFPAIRPLFDTATPQRNNSEAKYIIKKMGLKPGMKFLDCPCGIGRISIPLGKKGIKVAGVDITRPYLEELRKKAQRLNLKIDLHEMDMREIKFKNKFDAAGNLWTSFGYFEKESDNLLVLKKAYQALKPGGKFLLNTINRDWIITSFQSRGWDEIGNLKIIQRREFDYRKSIMRSTWILIKDGEEEHYDVDFYMYSFHELVKMFESVGFENIEGYGSIKDDPIGRNTRMMYIFGTKPKRKRK